MIPGDAAMYRCIRGMLSFSFRVVCTSGPRPSSHFDEEEHAPISEHAKDAEFNAHNACPDTFDHATREPSPVETAVAHQS